MTDRGRKRVKQKNTHRCNKLFSTSGASTLPSSFSTTGLFSSGRGGGDGYVISSSGSAFPSFPLPFPFPLPLPLPLLVEVVGAEEGARYDMLIVELSTGERSRRKTPPGALSAERVVRVLGEWVWAELEVEMEMRMGKWGSKGEGEEGRGGGVNEWMCGGERVSCARGWVDWGGVRGV